MWVFCLFQTLCELRKQAQNRPHHAEREWWEAFISDVQSAVRPWSPEPAPRLTPDGPHGATWAGWAARLRLSFLVCKRGRRELPRWH